MSNVDWETKSQKSPADPTWCLQVRWLRERLLREVDDLGRGDEIDKSCSDAALVHR